MSKHQQDFIQKLTNTLDHGVADLDDDVLARLRHARMAAVNAAIQADKAETTPVIASVFPQWLAPTSSVAAFATVALVSFTLWQKQPAIPESFYPTVMEDLTILSSQDELEFYQNLDFYFWLASDESNS